MKNKNIKKGTKKKRTISPETVEYPEIVPFSSFSAISIECPQEDFDLHCPPQFIPKRIPNPPTERDQSTLPISTESKIKKKNETQKKDIMYHFSSKELPTSKNILPDFDVVRPISAQALVSTDGVRQIIQYRQPKIIDLLRPQIKSSHSTNQCKHDDITFPPTHVSLQFNEKPLNIEKYINYLFKSVIAPSQRIEEFDISLAKPPLRSQRGPQLPLPTLPASTNISLIDLTISLFERKCLIPSYSKVYCSDFSADFVRAKKGGIPRYIRQPSDLSLLEGEFVVVECIERNPVIRPMIGMSAQLNVVIDSSQNIDFSNPETKHPFDHRIPVTQITSTSIQPFISSLPKDKFVIEMSNSVSTAAISPHKSSSTDFVLVSNANRLFLLEMPDQIYLSTPPESTVIIPRPKTRKLEFFLNKFMDSPLPSPEELCKARSTVEGILYLSEKGIERLSPPSISTATMEKLLKFPPKMRALIGQYLRTLKTTPWIRSSSITRARLGLTKGMAEFIDYQRSENERIQNAKDAKNQTEKKKLSIERRAKIRTSLSTSFENYLHIIESAADEEQGDDEDMMMDLSFMDESDENNWNENLDDFELADVKTMADDPITSKTKIDWNALGLGNLPMRKVMKVIDYQLEDENVVSSVSWIRDQNLIAEHEAKIKRSKKL